MSETDEPTDESTRPPSDPPADRGANPDAGRAAMAAILKDEAGLLGAVSDAIEAAAAHARRIKDPDALAEIQARNLAAFEQLTIDAGERATALLRSGVTQALENLEAGSTTAPASAVEPERTPPHAEPEFGDLTKDLNDLRRATLLESLRRVSAGLAQAADADAQAHARAASDGSATPDDPKDPSAETPT